MHDIARCTVVGISRYVLRVNTAKHAIWGKNTVHGISRGTVYRGPVYRGMTVYGNIRLSTNDQLIFLPSAKRGVDKKSRCKIEIRKKILKSELLSC